jgi:hypothetical protein
MESKSKQIMKPSTQSLLSNLMLNDENFKNLNYKNDTKNKPSEPGLTR